MAQNQPGRKPANPASLANFGKPAAPAPVVSDEEGSGLGQTVAIGVLILLFLVAMGTLLFLVLKG